MTEFHIGDILSITTEALVSPEGIGGIYKILGYLVDDAGIMTHQLPRVMRECAPYLCEQFPDLAAIQVPSPWPDGDPQKVVLGWLDEQVSLYGETRDVVRMPAEDHTYIDPITELRMMSSDAEIITVVVPNKEV